MVNLYPIEHIKIIAEEIEKFNKGKSNTQRLLNSIKKREEIIDEVKIINSHINTTSLGHDLLEDIKKLLEHLRISTLLVIENGLRLRKELLKMSRRKQYEIMTILHNNENYFMKILDDNVYIENSDLSKIFSSIKKLDLFFLNISQPRSKKKNSKELPQINPKNNSQIVLNAPSKEIFMRMRMIESAFLKEINAPNLNKINNPSDIDM